MFVIIGSFLVALLKYEFPILIRWQQIKKLKSQCLSRIESISSFAEDSLKIRADVKSLLQSKAWLRGAVENFDKAWRDAYRTEFEAAFSPVHLRDFLDARSLLPERAVTRISVAMPQILVTLGILGTFLGLVFTLPGLGVYGDARHGQVLNELVTRISEGLGLAFWTSICGISLSIVYILTNRIATIKLENAVEDLSDEVSRAFPSLSESRRELLHYQELNAIHENLETLGNDIATSLTDALEPAFDRALSSHLAPAIEKIQQAVEQMATLSSERQLEGVQKIVDQFLGSMNQALGDQFRELQGVLDSAVRSQRSIGEGLEGFSLHLQEAAEVQKNLIEETTRAGETLKGSLDRLEIISSTLGEAAEKIVDAGAQLHRSAEAASEAQRIARSAQSELLEATKSNSEAMHEARISLEQAWEKATEQARGAIYQIQQATRELGEGIGEKLVRALQTFDGSLSEVIERFSGTLSEVDGAISELPGAADRIGNSAEKLAEQVQIISQSVGQARDVFQNANRMFVEMRNTVASFSQDIAPLEKSLSRVVSSLDGNGSLNQISGQVRETKEVFVGIQKAVAELQGVTTKIGKEFSQFLSNRDSDGDLKKLVRLAQQLNENMEKLEGSFERSAGQGRKSLWPFGK